MKEAIPRAKETNAYKKYLPEHVNKNITNNKSAKRTKNPNPCSLSAFDKTQKFDLALPDGYSDNQFCGQQVTKEKPDDTDDGNTNDDKTGDENKTDDTDCDCPDNGSLMTMMLGIVIFLFFIF